MTSEQARAEAPSSSAALAFNQSVFTQVINLDRSPERLATIKAFLDTAGVEFVRFSAVEGAKLDLENDPKLKRLLDLKAWVRGHHRNPTPADIGCYLSHLYALEAFIAQDKPFGLIFEDDAALKPDFVAAVAPALEDPALWDILKLHARHPGPIVLRKRYGSGPDLCSYVVRHAGATAYIVNKEAAAKMVRHMIPARRMNDWTYDQGHLMNLKVRTLWPEIVTLQLVPTTRAGVKKKRSWLERTADRPLLPRWSLPFRRGADDLHRVLFNLFADGGLAAMLGGPKR